MKPIHDFSKRAEVIEEMDKTDCDHAVLLATVRRFELTNRLFTRYRTLLQHHVLRDMRRQPGQAYRLTDLGAGGCDTARWLVDQCRRGKLNLTIRAIEQDPRVADFARQANAGYPEIEVMEADACDRTCWGTPDYVFAQHLLHHLPEAACLQLLKSLDQAMLRCFIISDLVRSRAAHHTYRLAVSPFARGTFLIEDGAASIRRGFRKAELERLCKAAIQRHPVRIHRLWPARLAIIGGPPAHSPREAGVQQAYSPDAQDGGAGHGERA